MNEEPGTVIAEAAVYEASDGTPLEVTIMWTVTDSNANWEKGRSWHELTDVLTYTDPRTAKTMMPDRKDDSE